MPSPARPPILHVASEYAPFARTGGLGEAVATLAAVQARDGRRVLALLPLYRGVRAVGGIVPAGDPFEVPFGPARETARLWRLPGADDGPAVYALEHDGFFDRPALYGELGTDYADNARRFAFFARAALAALPRLARGPVLLHAHDWHAALAPLYLRSVLHGDPAFARVRTVLTVHNPGYQGHFPASIVPDAGLPWSVYDWRCLEWYGQANFLKGGLATADMVVTVSPQQAAELRTPDGGFGLHETFAWLGDRLVGILNGIDQAAWDPSTDPGIAARFSRDDLAGKRTCKAALQRATGLPERPDLPLFAFAGRLTRQKGFDLILAGDEPFPAGAQWAFLGQGEPRYAERLLAHARRVPDRVTVEVGFSDAEEHRLLAGADLFLMPSEYEPCGLTQMRAQRYGTIPIARRVGGLVDTVEDGVTGFMFDAFAPEAYREAAARAVAEWRRPARWARLQRRAMARDFGWDRAVRKYASVYRRALARA